MLQPSQLGVDFVDPWLLKILLLPGDPTQTAGPDLLHKHKHTEMMLASVEGRLAYQINSIRKHDQAFHIINKTLEGK